MAHESFLLNLHNAYSALSKAKRTEAEQSSPRYFPRVEEHLTEWLSPNSLNDFSPNEFPELPTEQRNELQREVEAFVNAARSANKPPTVQQVQDAQNHFERVVERVRMDVLSEWRTAVEQVFADIEKWSEERGWATRRASTMIKESFLGEYEMPTLLIHTPQNIRYLMTPSARLVVAGTGRMELCLYPSMAEVSIVRTDNGWEILPEVAGEDVCPLSRETFLKTTAWLNDAA